MNVSGINNPIATVPTTTRASWSRASSTPSRLRAMNHVVARKKPYQVTKNPSPPESGVSRS